MTLKNKKVGFGFTGSFCTFDKVIVQLEKLKEEGADIYPVFSERSYRTDSRFGDGKDFIKKVEKITGKEVYTTIVESERFGPSKLLDIFIIAPCSGNSLAKLATGITDSSVLMAAKGHLRNKKPLVIAVSTNDALGINLRNIGTLMNSKHIYFVPFGQDNYKVKGNSMVADFDKIIPTIKEALNEKQIEPVIICPK